LVYPCDLVYDGENLIPESDFWGEPVFESGQFSKNSFAIERNVLRRSTAFLEYQVDDQAPQLIEITLNEERNEIDIIY
jgi:hypothetical protein